MKSDKEVIEEYIKEFGEYDPIVKCLSVPQKRLDFIVNLRHQDLADIISGVLDLPRISSEEDGSYTTVDLNDVIALLKAKLKTLPTSEGKKETKE
jgi:hypothetical protein